MDPFLYDLDKVKEFIEAYLVGRIAQESSPTTTSFGLARPYAHRLSV